MSASRGDARVREDGNGPIYIGGLDRCGKTTMAAFLSSHPRIAIPAVGSNMWTYFADQFGDLANDANLERCLDGLFTYKHVVFLQPDRERVRREFREGPATYGRLFSLFLIHYAERIGKPRWGAQTGLIERYAEPLFDAYPGVKVIHMIRDPRDRYEASLARWPDGKGRAGGATARWLYSARLAERNVGRFPQSYLIVRFEDMVADPEGTVRSVCQFVGEEFTPEMMTMHATPKHRDRLSSGDSTTDQPVALSNAFVGLYRDRVPKAEIEFIQRTAHRRMAAHGYTDEPLSFTPRERLTLLVRDWPSQAARMVAWRSIEAAQHHFPRYLGRSPGPRMIVEEPVAGAEPRGVT